MLLQLGGCEQPGGINLTRIGFEVMRCVFNRGLVSTKNSVMSFSLKMEARHSLVQKVGDGFCNSVFQHGWSTDCDGIGFGLWAVEEVVADKGCVIWLVCSSSDDADLEVRNGVIAIDDR